MNFNLEEARHFLGLPVHFEAADLHEAEEEMVFPHRDYFLRNPPLKPLWESKIKKLLTIAAAVRSLGFSENIGKIEVYPLSHDSVLDLLSSFEIGLAALRTQMAESCSAMHTAEVARYILDLDQNCMQTFLKITDEPPVKELLDSKARRPEAGLLRRLLRDGKAEEISMLISAERTRIAHLFSTVKK